MHYRWTDRSRWYHAFVTWWVALRIWLFWAWGAAVIGSFLRSRGYGISDAILGGLGGMWVFALLFGLTFGIVGLFNSWVLWGLLAGGTVWVWSR